MKPSKVDKRRLLMDSEGKKMEALTEAHRREVEAWKRELPDRKEVG